MRLLTEIEAQPAPLPDHIEIGIRVAGMKAIDARRMQQAAALNSESVRLYRGVQEPRTPLHRLPVAVLAATERHAAEQYAYARYLMGIDNYWITLPHLSTKERMDYWLARGASASGGVATPAPVPVPAATDAPGAPAP